MDELRWISLLCYRMNVINNLSVKKCIRRNESTIFRISPIIQSLFPYVSIVMYSRWGLELKFKIRASRTDDFCLSMSHFRFAYVTTRLVSFVVPWIRRNFCDFHVKFFPCAQQYSRKAFEVSICVIEKCFRTYFIVKTTQNMSAKVCVH